MNDSIFQIFLVVAPKDRKLEVSVREIVSLFIIIINLFSFLIAEKMKIAKTQ